MKCKYCVFHFVIITLIVFHFNSSSFAAKFIDLCKRDCETQLTFDTEFEISENLTCKQTQCRSGCHLYKNALSSSCEEECRESNAVIVENRFCEFGCNRALNLFIENVKSEIGTPQSPQLVADSLTNTSLVLEWQTGFKTKAIENITYLIQWKYASINSEWIFYKPEHPLSGNRELITGLHAYTAYIFRIAWIIHNQYSPIYSIASVEIVTKSFGVPSTSPLNVKAIATSANHISVTWEPPQFPNGPIVAYYLYINDSFTTTVKQIQLSKLHNSTSIHTAQPLHYIFRDLKESTVYKISISCRNSVGEGPKWTEFLKTLDLDTFEGQDLIEDSNVFVVVASEKRVLRTKSNLMSSTRQVFRLTDYTSHDNITSIDIHFSKQLLFIADTAGNIRKVGIIGNDEYNQPHTIVKSKHRSSSKNNKISVDWLNDKLYVFEGNSINRFDLNGQHKATVITGFDGTVTELHIDPYNGYLYWSYSSLYIGGIYRIDMSRFDQRMISFKEAELIHKDKFVQAFTIDYSNFRLYYIKKTVTRFVQRTERWTLMSLTLSGSDSADIRVSNVEGPRFNGSKSLIYYNDTFLWVAGTDVFKEEYHKESGKYFHNAFEADDYSLVALRIFHPKLQPYPLPHNSVENLEAVFTDTTAKVSWNKPSLLGGMAQGAWQDWLYDINVEEKVTSIITEISNISKTNCDLLHLKPNTIYKISVRASSKAGKGPWSSTFIGTTLKAVDTNLKSPFILWATKDGRLLQSNLVADNMQTLLNLGKMNKTVVKDLVFLNLNNTSILVHNSTNHSTTTLKAINTLKSIAIDWITPKLYWSNPVTQVIVRSNLNGSQHEIVRMMTVAKQLAIDAVNAMLYWITDYSVERSQLNGMHHKTYFTVEHFSGKQVMGLTLDLDRKALFWVLRHNSDYLLYKMNFNAGDNYENPIQFIKSTAPPNDAINGGSLWYFNNRFFVHHFSSVLVTDLKGRNAAFLRPGVEKVETIEIVDQSLHKINDSYGSDSRINVIPDAVNASTVFLDVAYDRYTVHWKAVSNVDFAEVFYEVSIKEDYDLTINVVTNVTRYTYHTKQHPSTLTLRIVIKSFTYWASSTATVVDLSLEALNMTGTVIPKVKSNEKYKTMLSGVTSSSGTSKLHNTSHPSYVLYIFITLFCTLIVFFVIFICHRMRKDADEKKVLREADIVTLQEIPPHLACENNVHYINGDLYMDEDLSSMLQLTTNQFRKTKYLGCGAFATVYEGVVYVNGEESKVAIKTIRNTATEQNRNDFLKEAKLMRNFQHKHILRLIGVCLERDTAIIFELMAGGDLLSYLRKNRPTNGRKSSLTMIDLLNICIDVSKGCKYLEEMHYVHRDLAARNCLVSSCVPSERIVKIGDFGLARDIYKNDYYRKDGNALLPVRWMAPESLMDGVFSTQSDIWSFGVLLWEVLTLGQQPYPARDNVQVLNFVKTGGRPDIPNNCPKDLVRLLNQCWMFQPESRPSFSICLKRLEQAKVNLSNQNICISPDFNSRLFCQSRGFDNPGYKEDESLKATLEQRRSKSATPSSFLSYSDSSQVENSSLKYVPIVEANDTDRDGYEIPRFSPSNVCDTPESSQEMDGNDQHPSADLAVSTQLRRIHRNRNFSPPPTYSQIFSGSNRTTLTDRSSNSETNFATQANETVNGDANLVYANKTSSESSDDSPEGPSVTAALLKPPHNSFVEAPSRNLNGLRLTDYLGKKFSSKYHKSLPCVCTENEEVNHIPNQLHSCNSLVKTTEDVHFSPILSQINIFGKKLEKTRDNRLTNNTSLC